MFIRYWGIPRKPFDKMQPPGNFHFIKMAVKPLKFTSFIDSNVVLMGKHILQIVD